MLRDNLVELIEPMLNSAGADPLALYIHTRTPASDDRLPCLKNPRPEGAESSLTESASSPFQAEPAQESLRAGPRSVLRPRLPITPSTVFVVRPGPTLKSGCGSDCRKAYISASSESETTLLVYGGICPVGCRAYRMKAGNEIGLGPILGPVVDEP